MNTVEAMWKLLHVYNICLCQALPLPAKGGEEAKLVLHWHFLFLSAAMYVNNEKLNCVHIFLFVFVQFFCWLFLRWCLTCLWKNGVKSIYNCTIENNILLRCPCSVLDLSHFITLVIKLKTLFRWKSCTNSCSCFIMLCLPTLVATRQPWRPPSSSLISSCAVPTPHRHRGWSSELCRLSHDLITLLTH